MNRLILPLMMFGRYRGKEYLPGLHPGLFPSANHIYTHTDHGKRLTAIAKQKLDEWQGIAQWWTHQFDWEMKCNQKIIIRLWFYLNDNRRKDTHNVLKLLLDSLEGVIYEDDRWCLPRVMDFEIDKENPRIEIEMEIA